MRVSAAVLMQVAAQSLQEQGETSPDWSESTLPWTGTCIASTTTQATDTESGLMKSSGSNHQQDDSCYSFRCNRAYSACYTNVTQDAFCLRMEQFCKVAVTTDRAGNVTVTAECVNQNCDFTEMSSGNAGNLKFSCCNSNLCNDENLLHLDKSCKPTSEYYYLAVLSAVFLGFIFRAA